MKHREWGGPARQAGEPWCHHLSRHRHTVGAQSMDLRLVGKDGWRRGSGTSACRLVISGLRRSPCPGPHGALDGHWLSSVGVPGSWLGEPGVGAAGGPVPGSA